MRVLRGLVQALVVAVLGLLLLELLLIAFNDLVFERSAFMRYDRELGFRVKPERRWAGGVTNALGFNDVDYPFERRPGTYRIVVIGDSFGWAGGVAGNYTNLLEERFARTWGEGVVEVVNTGFGGTHTGEQLAILRELGMRYHPDLVVLSFFTGNDVFDASSTRRRIIVGSSLVDVDTSDGREWTLFGQPLVLQSRLWLALRDAWKIRRNLRAVERERAAEGAARLRPGYVVARDDGRKDADPGGEVGLRLLGEQYVRYERGLLDVAKRERNPRWAAREALAFANVRAMADYVGREGADFLVYALPAAFHVDPTLQRSIEERFDLDLERDYDLAEPMRSLGAMCAEHGIPFVDPTGAFRRAAAEGAALYQRNDPHFSLEGNRVAARALYDALRGRVEAELSPRT